MLNVLRVNKTGTPLLLLPLITILWSLAKSSVMVKSLLQITHNYVFKHSSHYACFSLSSLFLCNLRAAIIIWSLQIFQSAIPIQLTVWLSSRLLQPQLLKLKLLWVLLFSSLRIKTTAIWQHCFIDVPIFKAVEADSWKYFFFNKSWNWFCS